MGRSKLGISNLAWDENIDFLVLKNNKIENQKGMIKNWFSPMEKLKYL